jgi:[glutamine synthetase] adenylyltransferase / [glutamine synthetase]-adenylyl-L-tyrosine phosphorylase
VIAGDASLAGDLAATIRGVLCRPANVESVRRDVLDMRRLMLAELGKPVLWDIKRGPGGLIDIEFIVQFLELVHAASKPGILDQNTGAALERVSAAGIISDQNARDLKEALALYQRLTQVLRLCVDAEFSADAAPAALQRLLSGACNVTDLTRCEQMFMETRAKITEIFEDVIGPYIV